VARYRRAVKVLRSLKLERLVHVLAGSPYAVQTTDPVFHLTYDDGPHPDVTPDVLDALDEGKATATFFVLTERAERYPDLIKETMTRGHMIGLHTRTHIRLSDASFSRLVDEVWTARKDLERVTGSAVRWFRPPYGAEGMRSIPVIRSARMTTLGWSVDTHDWKGLSAVSPLGAWTKRIDPGGVALLHDVPARETLAQDRSAGLVTKGDLTRHLLEELNSRSIRPVSLDVLLAAGPTLRRAKLA
jgi:peptidoglycan/xylan/chitin deacetylase (PgdA/CDA1 family)